MEWIRYTKYEDGNLYLDTSKIEWLCINGGSFDGNFSNFIVGAPGKQQINEQRLAEVINRAETLGAQIKETIRSTVRNAQFDQHSLFRDIKNNEDEAWVKQRLSQRRMVKISKFAGIFRRADNSVGSLFLAHSVFSDGEIDKCEEFHEIHGEENVTIHRTDVFGNAKTDYITNYFEAKRDFKDEDEANYYIIFYDLDAYRKFVLKTCPEMNVYLDVESCEHDGIRLSDDVRNRLTLVQQGTFYPTNYRNYPILLDQNKVVNLLDEKAKTNKKDFRKRRVRTMIALIAYMVAVGPVTLLFANTGLGDWMLDGKESMVKHIVRFWPGLLHGKWRFADAKAYGFGLMQGGYESQMECWFYVSVAVCFALMCSLRIILPAIHSFGSAIGYLLLAIPTTVIFLWLTPILGSFVMMIFCYETAELLAFNVLTRFKVSLAKRRV